MRFMREIEERNTARNEGRSEGFTEGITKGRSEGRTDSILEILENLGRVPKDLKVKIQNQKDETILMKWLLLAAKAESVEDFADKL